MKLTFSRTTCALGGIDLRRHPQGCGYTNEARPGGLKLLKPAFPGFVCVGTPLRVSLLPVAEMLYHVRQITLN
jgi:hypothetical protein